MSQLPIVHRAQADLMVGEPAYLQKLQAQGALTPDQWQRLEEYFAKNISSPMQPSIICKDLDCPYINSCPLKLAKVARPTGDPCVIEETVKRNWAEIYLNEVGTSEDGYPAVDTGVVIDLVNTLLDLHRAQMEVADSPEVAERTLRGFDKDQRPIIDLKMNPLHFYLKNARLLKMKLLDLLVASRDARKKDKSRQTNDQAQLLTKMRESLDAARQLELERRQQAADQLQVAAAVVVESPADPEDTDAGTAPPTD